MDYKDVNDYELMYLIKENDEDAVNLMIGKYEPIIINIARKFYPKVKLFGAEMDDLVQEGRIAVIKAINSYNQNSVSIFYTYVCICIERRMITYLRNLSTSKQSPLNYSIGEDRVFSIADMSLEPVNYLTQMYVEESIVNSKYLFDFLDSNIFELRYNGFSYREISELLDIPIRMVDSRLSKMRKTLQRKGNKF